MRAGRLADALSIPTPRWSSSSWRYCAPVEVDNPVGGTIDPAVGHWDHVIYGCSDLQNDECDPNTSVFQFGWNGNSSGITIERTRRTGGKTNGSPVYLSTKPSRTKTRVDSTGP